VSVVVGIELCGFCGFWFFVRLGVMRVGWVM
jgi:hypothetical protein